MDETCPICGGVGYRLKDSKRSTVMIPCECQHLQYIRYLHESANIPPKYRECNFSTFKKEDRHPSQLACLDKVFHYFTNFAVKKKGLLLMGPCGVGKTHLAVSLIHALIAEDGVQCLFVDFRRLLQNIRNSYDHESQVTEEDIMEPIFNAQVLLLDELGAEKVTGFVREKIHAIIDYRYCHEKKTIITTNYMDDLSKVKSLSISLTADELKIYEQFFKDDETLEDRIGPRIRSRLYEMCENLVMMGNDYRRLRKK